MKKIFICVLVLISAAVFQTASAQFQVNNNIKSQPKWTQAGHDYVEYIYLPDIDTYYYVPRQQFIYQTSGQWTFSSSLPATHKKYNLFSANKVVINEAGAYRYNARHKAKYASGQTVVTKSLNKINPTNKADSDEEKNGG